jgi:hypothetical protein
MHRNDGDFALGLLQDLDLVALAVAELEVHALEHRGPVLRLGAARAGLDVDEAGVGIQGIVEHALELELVHVLLQPGGVLRNALQRRLVLLRQAELQQFVSVGETARDGTERLHRGFEVLLLAPELLGALRVGPDLRVLQRLEDFYEPRLLAVVVKGTSSAPRTFSRGLRAGR